MSQRTLVTAVLLVSSTIADVRVTLHAEQRVAAARNITGGEDALKTLVLIGDERSETFRELIQELRASRGFVYLGWSPSLPNGLHGALLQRILVTPDGVRCLWLAFKRTKPDQRLIPLIAHELQHAVEALASGGSDAAGLEAFFRRVAHSRHGQAYETAAALKVQALVDRELRKWRAPVRGVPADAEAARLPR